MTLLFAALLGNFLAWCVHTFTWWLREKCFGVVAVLGVFCSIPLSLTTYILSFNEDFTGPSYLRVNMLYALAGWLLVCITGCVQSFLLKKRHNILLFISALVAEIFLGILLVTAALALLFNSYLRTFLVEPENIQGPCVFVFFATLLTLALIRPQVVKVQKWLWLQVKPKRATNE